MPRRRRDETDKGLWSIETGERPFTVRVREDKTRGSNVVLDYREPSGKRRVLKVRPAFSVRDERGRIDDELARLAEDAGKRKSAELRLGVLEQDAEPERMTLGRAFALYMDPVKGGMQASAQRQGAYRRSRDAWAEWLSQGGGLGEHTPWNRITPADVEGLAFALKAKRMVPTARERVSCLSAVYNWLKKKARIRALEDPTEGFDWKRLEQGYRARQHRYTRPQLEALLRVRYQVDPRFALALALTSRSVTRGGEVRTLWRSEVDWPLALPPTREQAPYGWVWFRGVKGQDPRAWPLTRFQREELFAAMVGYDAPETGEWRTGYLRGLELRWLAEGVDYPLFPGRRLRSAVKRTDLASSYRYVSSPQLRDWLAQAETLAGLPHVEYLSMHGIRRAISDFLEEEVGLGVLTAAGGWMNQATPERVYLDRKRYAKLDRARRALED